jgi:hypothetical protein
MRYAVLVCKHHDGFANWPPVQTGASGQLVAMYEGRNIGHKAICRIPLVACSKVVAEEYFRVEEYFRQEQSMMVPYEALWAQRKSTSERKSTSVWDKIIFFVWQQHGSEMWVYRLPGCPLRSPSNGYAEQLI